MNEIIETRVAVAETTEESVKVLEIPREMLDLVGGGVVSFSL